MWNFVRIAALLSILANTDGRNTLPKVRLLPGRLTQRHDFVHLCENVSQSLSVKTMNIQTNEETHDIMVNADFALDRRVERITQVIVRYRNCADTNKGSCQLFQTWRFGTETCGLLAKKNQLWSNITENATPPIHCPFEQGEYLVRNATVNTSVLERMPIPLEKYYWRTRVECYDPQLYLCFEVGTRFMRKRS